MGTWEGHCVGTHQQGHGCLQRDGQCHRELPCPQLLVLVSKPTRCAGSVQCVARVQGCCEGGAAVKESLCRCIVYSQLRTSSPGFVGHQVQGVLDLKSMCPCYGAA